ncbi:hypothetical protein BDY17DRAFT_323543 [Neohortaea acidophila]|uniref:Uncharacterized protein n=1 Tax=Neohortaea acidophila TaxID=245834 RepID=A0A6A6PY99_9PEZI|nr:uncharacterized protein BDY17DRAFT_323543 [Neohortaea acidophila]KAF2484709.1 hypothetical protein BDY17DRAFT_323543 [Neohortaea acidophila]
MSSNDNGDASGDANSTPASHAPTYQASSENDEYPSLPPDSPLTDLEEPDEEEAATRAVRQMGPPTELEAATEQLRQRIAQVEGPTVPITDWDAFLALTEDDHLDDDPCEELYTVEYTDPCAGPGQARSETLVMMMPAPESSYSVHDPKKDKPWFPPQGADSELAQAHLRHMLAYKKQTSERSPSRFQSDEDMVDAASPITRPTPRLWQDQEAQKSSRRHKNMAQRLDPVHRSYFAAFTGKSEKGSGKRTASDDNAGPSSRHARKRRRVAVSDAVDTEATNKAQLDTVMKFLTSGRPLSPLRRICRHEQAIDTGLAQPQGNPAGIRQKVADLAERFWENVEGERMPKTYDASNTEPLGRYTMQTAEEYYVVDWDGADPLEPLFDEPTRPIGVFDDTEFEYWRHQQWKETVEGPKKRGRRSAADKAEKAERQQEYEDEFEMSGDELEEDFRTLEKNLVAQKKMLPTGVKPNKYWTDPPKPKKGKAAPKPKTTSEAAGEGNEEEEEEASPPNSSIPTDVLEASSIALLAQWLTEGKIEEQIEEPVLSAPKESRVVVLKVDLRPAYRKWLLEGRIGGNGSWM